MSDAQPAPDDLPSGFAEHAGVEWVDVSDPAAARARVRVGPEHLQPNGIVHGGVYATLAESLASAATSAAVVEEGKVAMGQANNTTFLRPVTEGTIHALARARHSGSTTWVWDVEMTDDSNRVCALSRMTIAVRPRRD